MMDLQSAQIGFTQYGGLKRFTKAMLLRCLQDGPQNARPARMYSQDKDTLARAVATAMRSDQWQSMTAVAVQIQKDRDAANLNKQTGLG